MTHWIPEDHENKNIIAISLAVAGGFYGCGNDACWAISEHSGQTWTTAAGKHIGAQCRP